MNSQLRGSVFAVLGLLALLLTAAFAGTAQAAWMGYRNDTNMPIVVQAASVQRNIVRRGAPHLLYKKDVAWDCIVQPGLKIITVHDAKDTKRVLYQGTVVSGTADLFFAIELEPAPTPRKGEKPLPPRAKLVPTSAPAPPPRLRR